MEKKLQELDRGLKQIYFRLFSKRSEDLRAGVSDNPKQYLNTTDFTAFRLRTRKESQLLGLAILSWYMPEEIGLLLQLQLEELSGSNNFKEAKILILTSKDYCLAWILLQKQWSLDSLFGNILDRKLARVWDSTEFLRIKTGKVQKYTGYCRGYRNSSHLSLQPSLPIELRVGTISVQEELQKEFLREQSLLHWKKGIENLLVG